MLSHDTQSTFTQLNTVYSVINNVIYCDINELLEPIDYSFIAKYFIPELSEMKYIYIEQLSRNPNALVLFKDYPFMACIKSLVYNKNTKISEFLLSNFKDKIDWSVLCSNKSQSVVDYLTKNPLIVYNNLKAAAANVNPQISRMVLLDNRINSDHDICIILNSNYSNPVVYHLIHNPGMIFPLTFMKNINPIAIKYNENILLNKLYKLPYNSKILWGSFACNTSNKAIKIISQNLHLLSIEEICYIIKSLSGNYTNYAGELLISIIDANPTLVNNLNWELLSSNPFAVPILQKYPKRISIEHLMLNPSNTALNMIYDFKDDSTTYYLVVIHIYNLLQNTNPRARWLMGDKLLKSIFNTDKEIIEKLFNCTWIFSHLYE